jgi:hypothetical protein
VCDGKIIVYSPNKKPSSAESLLAACALNIQYIKCYGRERARKLPAHELALHKHHKGKLQMVLIIAAAKPHYNNVSLGCEHTMMMLSPPLHAQKCERERGVV